MEIRRMMRMFRISFHGKITRCIMSDTRRSRIVTQGIQRSPNRALLRAVENGRKLGGRPFRRRINMQAGRGATAQGSRGPWLMQE